ncbi:MAG TPA: GDP-L-fucose synthase [Gemmatimonadaceae bacterium]|nr:GDP-L-fucose synthase [Gemmatimonadaceae bacterium]
MSAPKVFVAGHRGLLGSALVRELRARGYPTPLTRSRKDLDLRNQVAVSRFFTEERPTAVFVAAAKVGGIQANSDKPWEFLLENLEIQNNLLGCALEHNVKRVVFFGSSCIYPKHADQPLREEYLLTGPLEPTNEFYAIAKIAGLKLVEAANSQYGMEWLSLMPTNLYGPGDNFDLTTSHVLPALIRKFHEAKTSARTGSIAPVRLWGTGRALREFLHVDDVAVAACDLMESGGTGLFNVGSGEEISIKDLAAMIARVVGYDGQVEWDSTKPDGTPRKLLDSSKIRATGWKPRISLADGIASTYEWYLRHAGSPRAEALA